MDTARDVIDDHQFGCLRGSSTVQALGGTGIHLWQKPSTFLAVALVCYYFDFSKAFDRVDHSLLLETYGNLGLLNVLVSAKTKGLTVLHSPNGQISMRESHTGQC